MEHPNKKIMEQVLDLAVEKNSVAAFVVRGDEIVAKEVCTIFLGEPLPTRHAEINAIEKASEKLDKELLEDCWLYSSLQPCPMCASAACWARMEGVVYCAAAEDRPKDENFDHWIYEKPEEIFENYKYAPKLVKEFMREEGKEKIDEFM